MFKKILSNFIIPAVLILASTQLLAADEFTEITNQQADEFVYLINKYQMLNDTAYSLNGTQVNDQCTVFMNKENIFGDLGKSISQELQAYPSRYNNLLNADDLALACPKYKSMNVQQKSVVITLLLTAMAHFESSCKISSSIKGPNGRTYGYWQLHKGKEQNYDTQDLCKKNDSTRPAASARCTLSMLDDQANRSDGIIFYRKSYWDVLRPNGRAKKAPVIKRTLQNFSLCKSLVI